MIKIAILAILMGLVLVSNATESASNHSTSVLAINCSSLVWNLANCSSFLSRGSTTKKPETSCCSGLKTLVKTDPDCFCEALKHSDQLGFTPNITRALSLPAACNVSVPSFSNCTSHPSPASASPSPAASAPAADSGTYFQSGPVPGSTADFYGDDYQSEKDNSRPKAIGLYIRASTAAMVTVMLFVICYCIQNSSNQQKDSENLDSIIKRHGFLAPKRYSYSQIEKMTNSFRDKLGEGGFGEVYKGTLIDGDGSPVAVKILKATKANGEEFINEVINISRTCHINVVTLLGFCIDRKKRALVYEFMPNGSLEKYIYKESMSRSSTSHLGWERLYQIALGVARGLEYLHRGCNTRILHFDIKPHNILLDQDFCPKISDFGLAKQCTRKESIISMIETRGTIGYIAPEVISRNFGGVSYKSDVYSYGMMLLEMVGGRKNICPQVSHASEIYFPHWAYQRMVVGGDLKLQGVTTGEENEIAKKMIIVGLWCIQNDPMQRPAMSKVIEMLEGSLEAMEIPPKPFFGSPSRSEADSSDTVGEIINIS